MQLMYAWKWIKLPSEVKEGVVVECTKDFIGEGNEYINEGNGWSKLENSRIEIGVEDGEKEDN